MRNLATVSGWTPSGEGVMVILPCCSVTSKVTVELSEGACCCTPVSSYAGMSVPSAVALSTMDEYAKSG